MTERLFRGATMTDPICFVGRKARRMPAGAGLSDRRRRPKPIDPNRPNITGIEAAKRLARRSFGVAEIIDVVELDGFTLTARSIPHQLLT